MLRVVVVGFGRHPRVIIDTSKVPEMKEIRLTNRGLVFGSSVTLTEMEEMLQETIDQLPGNVVQAMLTSWYTQMQSG